MQMWEKFSLSGVVGFLTYYLGGWDTLLKSLLFLIVIDYLTGVANAVYHKRLSSKIGFQGIIKKICILVMVSCSVVIGSILNQNDLHNLIILLYIGNEIASLIENVSDMGVMVPEAMKEKLGEIVGKGKKG